MNNINLLTLAKRHSTFDKQDISIVDMRKEKGTTVISTPLIEKISEKINKSEQVILFLNKRGFANFLFCPTCGFTYKCPHCDITLTYHMQEEHLLCHYCGYKLIVPLFCASCNSDNLRRSGYGTEKVEEALNQLFTEKIVIARMDSDTMKKRTAYEKIFTRFKNREINILIGTQMIAKGLHYPNVTLVGIIMADVSLNLPDFRASERSYSLLTQVSGRAGRGNLQGEVIIQTYQPEHYVIQTAKEQNFHQFYEQEIRLRRQYYYPPFSRLIKLLVRGKDQQYVRDKSMEMYELIKPLLQHYKNVDILGPAPCPIQKINDNYRWQMILRGNSIKILGILATSAREYMRKDSKIYLEIDVDPVFMG